MRPFLEITDNARPTFATQWRFGQHCPLRALPFRSRRARGLARFLMLNGLRVDSWRHSNLVWLVLLVAGCRQVAIDGTPLLADPQMTETSVVLDLFFVRLPYGDERINGALWGGVDEQLSPMLRQKLAQQGFRAGICSTHPPETLELLLNEFASAAPAEENITTELVVEPMVRRRHLQLPAGRPAEVIASGFYESLPLLRSTPDGQVSGQTLPKAQAVFSVQAFPQSDGRVRIQLRPEVQYGEPHRQFSQRDTHLILDSKRSSEVLDDLIMEAELSAGEMIVLSCLPNRPGSAGHSFFTEAASDGLIQKMLVVRLSQTQRDSALGMDISTADETAH